MLPRQGGRSGVYYAIAWNTGFLVAGHRDRPRLANLAAQQSFIENLYFLVCCRHLGLESRRSTE